MGALQAFLSQYTEIWHHSENVFPSLQGEWSSAGQMLLSPADPFIKRGQSPSNSVGSAREQSQFNMYTFGLVQGMEKSTLNVFF